MSRRVSYVEAIDTLWPFQYLGSTPWEHFRILTSQATRIWTCVVLSHWLQLLKATVTDWHISLTAQTVLQFSCHSFLFLRDQFAKCVQYLWWPEGEIGSSGTVVTMPVSQQTKRQIPVFWKQNKCSKSLSHLFRISSFFIQLKCALLVFLILFHVPRLKPNLKPYYILHM